MRDWFPQRVLRTLMLGALTTLALAAGAEARVERAAAPAAARAATAVLAERAVGSIDADLLDRRGRLLGHVRASLARSGRGGGVLRAAAGSGALSQVLSVRGQGTRLRLAGRHGLRLTARLGRDGRLQGTGRLGKRPVRLAGVGGEQHPHLRKGMNMLVVGKPRGEGYRALLKLYKPVRYRPGTHTRTRLLQDRQRFHRFAALVFGPGTDAAELRTHRLLHAFYGTGKWIILAPSQRSTQAALGNLHAYTPGRPSAALAVRSTGAPGDHDNVRPTILYPAKPILRSLVPGTTPPPLSTTQQRAATHRHATWFRQQLLQRGHAHIRPGNRSQRHLQANTGAAGTVPILHFPKGSMALELQITFNQEFTLTGSAGWEWYRTHDFCGHSSSNHDTWCWESWTGKWGDAASACNWFLSNDHSMQEGVLWRAHPEYYKGPGHYNNTETWNFGIHGKVSRPWPWSTFRQLPGKHTCPRVFTQTTSIFGTDYYYALYDFAFKRHSVIAISDPTIKASSTGQLAIDNQANGTYQEFWDCCDWSPDRQLKETMLFLGAYEHETAISGGPQLDDQTFAYSSGQSYPTSQITFTSQGESRSETETWDFGVFGDALLGTKDYMDSFSSSTSWTAPSWKVSPIAGKRRINYQWATNDPVPWQTILDNDATGLAGKPPTRTSFGLNDINRGPFVPSSLTTWSGWETWGKLSITSTRRMRLVDHFSYFDSTIDICCAPWGPVDAFWITTLEYSNSPDATPTNDPNELTPGINLCDPVVHSKTFVGEGKPCGGS